MSCRTIVVSILLQLPSPGVCAMPCNFLRYFVSLLVVVSILLQLQSPGVCYPL